MMHKSVTLKSCTFHMATYASFKTDVAKAAFEGAETGLPEEFVSTVAWLFTIIEGYVEGVDCEDGAPLESQVIAQYVKERATKTMKERTHLFVGMFNFEISQLLIDAFNATRDKTLEAPLELQVVEDDEDPNFTSAASGQ
jgi:hypothetical protein